MNEDDIQTKTAPAASSNGAGPDAPPTAEDTELELRGRLVALEEAHNRAVNAIGFAQLVGSAALLLALALLIMKVRAAQ